jgi:hypothetical protein
MMTNCKADFERFKEIVFDPSIIKEEVNAAYYSVLKKIVC